MVRFPVPTCEGYNKKLKELILYIAEVCKNDSEFGATKLNKILFVIDFYAYSVLGRPITEATYFHLPKGPAPKQLLVAQEELIAEGRATIEKRAFFGKTQKRLIPLRGPNISMFLKDELNLIEDAIKATGGLNGRELSDWTHRLTPWMLTEEKEEIPFFTVFTMFEKPVGRDGLAWGTKELEKLKDLGYVS